MEKWLQDRKVRELWSCLALSCNFLAAMFLMFGLQIESLSNRQMSLGATAILELGGLPGAVISGEYPLLLYCALVLLAIGSLLQFGFEGTRKEGC